MSRLARAILPAAAAAFVVLLFGSLYGVGYGRLYAMLLTGWGANPFRFPFVDTHAVLSAVECHRLGIDVYAANPCDVLGRIHVYSPLWLSVSVLPITTAWTLAVGLTIAVAFLLSLLLLPVGRGWWHTFTMTLGTISSTTAFATERGNVDIIIFILSTIIVGLAQRSRRARAIAYGVVLLAAMLKFYPITLLILALRERLAALVKIGILSAVAGACFWVLYAHDLSRIFSSIPTTNYFDAAVFGARDLPYGLAQIYGWPGNTAAYLLGALAIATVAYAATLGRRGDLLLRLAALGTNESFFLLIGCVLLLGCFFSAQNGLYRGIYFLFVLPALTAMARVHHGRRRDQFVVACVLVVLLMWEGMIRRSIDLVLRVFGLSVAYISAVNFATWLFFELVWWAVVTILTTLLIALMLRSQALCEVFACLPASWQRRRSAPYAASFSTCRRL